MRQMKHPVAHARQPFLTKYLLTAFCVVTSQTVPPQNTLLVYCDLAREVTKVFGKNLDILKEET